MKTKFGKATRNIACGDLIYEGDIEIEPEYIKDLMVSFPGVVINKQTYAVVDPKRFFIEQMHDGGWLIGYSEQIKP